MARVTIEDCVKKVDSRFELVALAAERAKAIASGAPLSIAREDEKNPVLALREIAMGNIEIAGLRESFVHSFQKPTDYEELPDSAAEQEQSLLQAELSDMKHVRQESTEDFEPEEEFDAEAAGGADFSDENTDVED